MATFTSTGTGDWDDGGTWGNTSPGAKGTDWPGLAGDIVNIGHDVSYNVSEANELAQVTINSSGILNFLTTANTKITLGHDDIRVNSGGEFRVGKSGTIIGTAYTAELVWNTTSDNAKGIYVADGGILNIFGDTTYYGSDDETALEDDAENTDDDTSIITKQDMSALWNIGDELTIKVEDAGDSTSYIDAIKLGTIQSMSGTTIVLDININADTGAGDTWEAPVVNMSRNVVLSKLSSDTGIGDYNSNRPRIYDLNASGNNNCIINNAQVTGFHSINSGYDFQFIESIIRNGLYGFYSGSNHIISGNVYSNQYGFYTGSNHIISGNVYSNHRGYYYGSNHIISGDVYSNQHGFNYSSNHIISGNVYSNQYGFNADSNHTVSGNVYSNQHGFYYGSNHTMSGNVYSNQQGFNSGSNHIMSGKIGYDSTDTSLPNTVADFLFKDGLIILRVAKLPSGGLVFSSRGGGGETGVLFSEDHNQVIGASFAYHSHGDVIKNTVTVRSGGADNSIEVIPLATMSIKNYVKIFEWAEFGVPASSQTRSTYMKGEAWTTWPTATELYFEAEYFDHATNVTKTVIKSTTVLTDNTTWEQFDVTFTPGRIGKVRYRAYLKVYEATAKVYIDNQLG